MFNFFEFFSLLLERFAIVIILNIFDSGRLGIWVILDVICNELQLTLQTLGGPMAVYLLSAWRVAGAFSWPRSCQCGSDGSGSSAGASSPPAHPSTRPLIWG